MQDRSEIFRNGATLFIYGCARCNRVFLSATPSKKTMDYRFKLGESAYSWKEILEHPVVPAVEAKRRVDAWTGKRMRRRCVPRFCPKCGALLGSLCEYFEKGRPRTVYGCPSRRSCGAAYIQPDKYFMRLTEVSSDWVEYERVCVRKNRQLRRVGR